MQHENDPQVQKPLKTREKYAREKVENIAEQMRALPPAESKKVTGQEAIHILSKDISLLMKRGYELNEISKIINKGGIKISTATLKSYMAKANHVSKRTPKKNDMSHTENMPYDTSISSYKTYSNTGYDISTHTEDKDLENSNVE